MTRWPISAISWNGYPPSQITRSMNCCRTTGGPQNNKKHPKRTKPTKAGLVKVCLPDGYKRELLSLGLLAFFFFIHLIWVLFDPSGTELFPIFMIHSVLLGFVELV